MPAATRLPGAATVILAMGSGKKAAKAIDAILEENMALKTAMIKLMTRSEAQFYFGAFPKEERMPFSMMVAMSKLWNTNFWAFYDKDVLCRLCLHGRKSEAGLHYVFGG